MRRSLCHTLLLLIALAAFGHRAALAESVAWSPEQTRAVIVGVLVWQDPSLGTFSPEQRQDLKLYQTLLERGVPPEQITLLLDEQATHAAIVAALREQVSAADPGDSFLFYYAGHGVRDHDGRVLFIPYDYTPGRGLSTEQIRSALEGSERLAQVLLFADCCHSGALEAIADDLEASGVPAASLTSATVELPSTSNWTFTQALVDGFSGANSLDRNGDLTVTFDELANEAGDAMRYYERQQSGVSQRAWLSDLVLSPTTAVTDEFPAPFRPYDYAVISYDGRKGIGRLTGFEGGQFIVELQAYSSRVSVDVPPEYLSPLPPRPTERLTPAQAELAASVNGSYSGLLQRIEVESDYLDYPSFHEAGYHPASGYRNYANLPAGHWVYVYPHWYIWEKAAGDRVRE